MPIYLSDAPKAHRFFLADFVSIQRNSFLNFLEKGLIEEFSKRNPITNNSKNIEVFFYPEYYQLTKPKYSAREAILKGKSYSSRLYVPVQFTDKKARIIQFKWAYIADLPIMTKRGHFIVNGAPRVIINQIIRSPGIYYQTKIYENFPNQWAQKADSLFERHYADLICQRGTWLRLEIDKNQKIWAQTKKGPKIPILWLLIAMGLTEKMILKSVMGQTSKKGVGPSTPPHGSIPGQLMGGAHESQLIYNFLDDSSEDSSNRDVLRGVSMALGLPEEQGDFSGEPPRSGGNKASAKVKPGTARSGGKGGVRETGDLKSEQTYISTPPEAWAAIYRLFNPRGVGAQKQKKSGKMEINVGAGAEPQNSNNSIVTSEQEGREKVSDGRNPDASLAAEPALVKVKSGPGGTMVPLTASELGRQFLFNKFMNPRTYDLSKAGRMSFNKKLNLSISLSQTTLTAQDLLAATTYLLKVANGLKKVDDIDHLKNRRVRTSGELIQIQFAVGLVRLEKIIREKIRYINLDTTSPKQIGGKRNSGFARKAGKPSVEAPRSGGIKHNTPKGEVSRVKKGGRKKVKSSQKQTINQYSIHWLTYNSGKHPNQFHSSLTKKVSNLNSVGEKGSFASKAGETRTPALSGGLLFDKNNKLSLNSLITTKAVNSVLREFFGTSPLSQFMDQINPLAELTHKRRLSSMGPGGVTQDSATLEIRGIHPSHYGRICPVETPEGKNTGLVNSLTTYARVNEQGFIETPFYRVYKGQVQKKLGMYFFSAEHEAKIRLGAADLFASDIGFLDNAKIPVRIEEFSKISRNVVEYVGVSSSQMVSIATSLIPFLEHDDANRALMGSNMQRQAVPLLKAERPIVGTGLEARAVSDSGHALQSKSSALVTYVSSEKIIFYKPS